MDQKAITTNAVTAGVTAVVMGLVAWGTGVFNTGTAALDEAQIEAVIEKILIRDNGATYAASLASIDGSLIAINTNIENIQGDIEDLEGAVRALASE